MKLHGIQPSVKSTEDFKPRFKIGDVVVYDGKVRPGCTHDNEECGRVLHLPNSAQPYYLIGVMEYGGGQLHKITYDIHHPVTFLANVEDLKLWKPDEHI